MSSIRQKHLKVLDLFSGIGGFSLGLEATGGFETIAFCEIAEYPRRVLKKHWPKIKCYPDIKKLTYAQLKKDGYEKIDVIVGGYPCQGESGAGRQKGLEDPRWLGSEFVRLISECRPTWVIGENVAGHIKQNLDTVLSDLESEGYSARTFSISASSIGANHKRERVWIVANSNDRRNKSPKPRIDRKEEDGEVKIGEEDSSTGIIDRADSIISSQESKTLLGYVAHAYTGNVERGCKRRRKIRKEYQEERLSSVPPDRSEIEDVADPESIESRSATGWTRGEDPERGSLDFTRNKKEGAEGSYTAGWWDIEPDVGRVANGIPNRVDRLKCLGNSLIPHIPYYIGMSILAS